MANFTSATWEKAKATPGYAYGKSKQFKGWVQAPAGHHLRKIGPIKYGGKVMTAASSLLKSKLAMGLTVGFGLMPGMTVGRALTQETLGIPAFVMGWHAGSALGGATAEYVGGAIGRSLGRAGSKVGGAAMAGARKLSPGKTKLAKGATVTATRSAAKTAGKRGALALTTRGAGMLVGGLGVGAAAFLAVDLAYTVATEAPGAIAEYGRRRRGLEMGAETRPREVSMPYHTNNRNSGYTMRSRALNQIQRSSMNARSAMGSEAYYTHLR